MVADRGRRRIFGVFFLLLCPTCTPAGRADQQNEARIVSLSPAVSETVVALGAAQHLVGISDYCVLGRQGADLPRVGSALTPNYESIARLSPSLILTSDVGGDQLAPLLQLAPTHALPWLTVEDFAQAVTQMGELLGRQKKAQALRERIVSELPAQGPADGARVLWVLADGAGTSSGFWFIRRNSIHGAALHAAGAKNAVERDVTGSPQLPPEEILRLDPDALLVVRDGVPERKAEERARKRFATLPLRAVREGRVYVLSQPQALSIGPQVLALAHKLRTTLGQLRPSQVQPSQVQATPP